MSTRNPFKRLAARATGDKLTPQATGTSTSLSDPFISPNPTGTTVSEADSHSRASEGKNGQTQDPFHDQAAALDDTAGASASTSPHDVADAMSNLTISTQPPALPPRRETMDDDSPPDTPQAPSPTASPPPHTPPRTPTQTQHSPPHQSSAPTSSSPPPLPPRQASTTNYAPPSSPPPGATRASPPTAGPSANARASSPPPPSFMSIDEDPPDYTPTPDYRHGEETLEYGPARPFQRPQHSAQGYHGKLQYHIATIHLLTFPQAGVPKHNVPNTPAPTCRLTQPASSSHLNPPAAADGPRPAVYSANWPPLSTAH